MYRGFALLDHSLLPVIKMKFNLLNKTSSFLIVLKFRKTYIQILKIV